MWRQWWVSRQSKLLLIRFLRLRAQPDEIAKGFAVGIFVGMTPFIGLHTAIAVFAAMIMGQNKIAAAMAVWVSNPVTAPFLYVAQYRTGRFILDTPYVSLPAQFNFESLSNFGTNLIVPLCLGSLIYGLLTAAVVYAVILRLVPVLKSWRIARWPRPFKRRQP